MFATLIRRKPARPLGQPDEAFDSTSFSLSMAVPRPEERRGGDRVMAMLRFAKCIQPDGREQLIRVRNVSAGGLMAEVGHPIEVGVAVALELSSQCIPATVVWTREGTAGFKFEQGIDLGEMLAGRKARHGFRPRPLRLEVDCKATIKLGKTYYTVDVRDISLAGSRSSRSRNIASASRSSWWSKACARRAAKCAGFRIGARGSCSTSH